MLQGGWDPERAVANCHIGTWVGRAWRAHRRVYAATDARGSRVASGRYHRAPDLFPEGDTWQALYLALAPETCLGEILRHITPDRLALLNEFRISEVAASLSAIVDCRDPTELSLAAEALWDDYDYSLPQALAGEAFRRGLEGMLVPSATRLGVNLIVFPTNLREDSEVQVVGSRDPRLYVQR